MNSPLQELSAEIAEAGEGVIRTEKTNNSCSDVVNRTFSGFLSADAVRLG
jgi:hypothetical protein